MQLFYKVIPESYKCFIRKVLSDHISCCIFDEAGKYRVTWIVSELKIFGVEIYLAKSLPSVLQWCQFIPACLSISVSM